MKIEYASLHRKIGAVCTALLCIALVSISHAQVPGPVPAAGAGTYGPPISTGNGHVGFGNGAPPALNSACGINPGPVNGTDAAFHFVSGTGTSNACTVTPATPYKLRPTCSIDQESSSSPAFSVSTSGAINLTGVVDSTRYYIICIAQPGGL